MMPLALTKVYGNLCNGMTEVHNIQKVTKNTDTY